MRISIHRRRERQGRSGGFALPDLAVVAGSLLLVTVVVVALVRQSREKSQLAVCVSNLGVVNKAVLSFANDNNKVLPAAVEGEKGDLWWFYKEQVKKYAGVNAASSPADAVFACPNDRGYTDTHPFHVTPRFDYGSYVFNGVTMPGMPNIGGTNIASIRKPAQTLLVAEWTAHAPLSWHRSKTGEANAPFYNDAESVVGFVDGHVRLTKIYYDGYNAAYTRDPIPGYDYQYSGK